MAHCSRIALHRKLLPTSPAVRCRRRRVKGGRFLPVYEGAGNDVLAQGEMASCGCG